MPEVTTGRQEATVRDFLNIVFKRKWLILSIVGAVTLLVAYLNASKPVVWESSSRILVKRGEQASSLTGSVRYLSWTEEVASQIEIILSDEVYERAAILFADSVRLNDLPADWTFNPASVRADVIGESNAFVIRYVNLDRRIVELGCAVMTEAFEEYYRERKAPPELTDFFTGEIVSVREDLAQWRGRRNEFLDREQFFGTTETSRILMSRVNAYETQLLSINADITEQRQRVENLKSLVNKEPAELEQQLAFSTSSQRVFQSGIVQNIKFQLQSLSLRREDLLHQFTEKHPEVQAVNRQIQDMRADLKRQVVNAYTVEKQRYETLLEQRSGVLENLAAVRGKLDEIPDQDRELTEIDNMIQRLEKRHQLLLDRQSESEIALASQPEWEVTVLSRASDPYTKKTRDIVRMALGPALALIVALGVAFFLESLDHSIKNLAEAEEFLEAPVLATISERK